MDKKKIIIAAVAAVIVIAAVIVLLCLGGNDNVAELSDALCDQTGIEIVGIDSYSGAYFEDGSDEAVENVMQLTVRNTGNTDYQLMNIYLTDKSGCEYCFTATTLLCGETMIILEKNRAAFDEDIDFADVRVEDCAIFEEAPSVHSDVFSFMVMDSSVTVENISDTDCNNISVFYKNYSDGVAVGGITYMLTIPSLAAGESAQIGTSHYVDGTSKLVFVVYG